MNFPAVWKLLLIGLLLPVFALLTEAMQPSSLHAQALNPVISTAKPVETKPPAAPTAVSIVVLPPTTEVAPTAPPSEDSPATATEATPVAAPTATVIPIQTVAAPPQLTDKEMDAIEEQREIVSRFPGPNELIDYFQDQVWAREFEKAILCVDFGTLERSTRSKQRMIRMLNTVLSRLDSKDVYDFPTAEKVMQQEFHSPQGMIELEFVRDDSTKVWKFSNRTVHEVEYLYDTLRNDPPIRHHWIMQHLPDWTLQPLFGVPVYRLLLLATTFFLGFVLKFLIEWTLFKVTRWIFNLMLHEWDRSKVTRRTWLPVGLLVLVTFWSLGLSLMTATPESLDFLHAAYVTFIIVMATWMLFRIVDLFSLWLRLRMKNRDANIDVIFFPLFTRTAKVLIFCFGWVSLAQAFQWPVVGVVSGLGIGGIAIAFAAKETIANLFGSVTVLADRPFVIGDWIKTGDIEGTVESVGMRSTRIRTFYNSLVTIPNNNLTTAVIDNMGARYYRRYRTFLSVPLTTEPERIDAFCEGVRELIRRHPYTRKDLFYVYLHEFKPSSLDILLNVFFVCPDASIEFRERGRLISDILRLAKELGVTFALPAQTIFQSTGEMPPKPLESEPVTAGRSAAIKIYPLDD